MNPPRCYATFDVKKKWAQSYAYTKGLQTGMATAPNSNGLICDQGPDILPLTRNQVKHKISYLKEAL